MKVVIGKGNLINNYLLVPLKCIIDLSLKYGTFPEKIEIARIIPVFKSSDTSLMTNYRPISVLLCFSKMLEMIIYNRLYISLKTIYYTIRSPDYKWHSPEST